MLTRRAVLAGVASLGGATALARGARAGAPGATAIAGAPDSATPLPTIHPRAAWKAAPALPGGRPHVATRFALHHTAGALVGAVKAPSTLRGVQAFHQRDKGWIDLAYHVFVDADGQAWEGRDPAFAGDTATAYDPAGYFLVCALGNFETTAPPAALLEGLARVLAGLHRARGIPLATLTPHRDVASTACPGARLMPHVEPIRLRAVALAGAPDAPP